LRGPEQPDREHADGRERDDETLTELPQVLRERHLLLIPPGSVVLIDGRRTFG
jgi:hypothetical protein